MERRIFIGDIQGCRIELERLLERVGFDPARDELQPVGDLVNRGPDSLGCLRLLRALDAGGVLGNHDLHLLHAAAGLRSPRPEDTLADVLAADDRDELLAWLARRPFVRVFPDVLLVHAGVHPAWGDPAAALAGADPLEPGPAARFAVSVRLCDAEGRQPGPGEEDEPRFHAWHEAVPAGGLAGRTVVFGHWAVQGLLVRPGLRGLDSGCVWGGRLSAWIAEEDRIVSVEAERAWAQIS